MSGHTLAGTTFGVLLSDDDGATWQWVCEEAINYGSSLLPSWHVTSTGRLLGGTFSGLFSSTDHGCTWTTDPMFGPLVDGGQGTGVAQLYRSGNTLFATSSKYGVVNRVWRSGDEGQTFVPTVLASAGEFYSSVRSAPSRPQRIYVSAWWFRPTYSEFLYISDNGGDTFTRTDVTEAMPLIQIADGGRAVGSGPLYVYAVNPLDPDTVFAMLQQQDDPQHWFIIESTDQGQHWSTQLDLADQINSLELSGDGQTIWVGSSGRVWRSTNGGATFASMAVPTKLSCIDKLSDRVFTCAWPDVDQFALGESDGGDGWSPYLTWSRVAGVVSCPGTSKVTTVCAPLFPALVANFGFADGGTGGGAGGTGGGGGGPSGGGGGGGGVGAPGCHCSSGAAELSLTLWLLLGRIAKAHALRRRRVHR